jgi:cytochrome c peroxidase
LPTADLGPDESVGDDAPDHEREAATIAMVRGTFQRLGFSDRETVCLVILGHQYGRCHPEVSGYEEAWYAFDPAHWNVYEHGLGYLSTYRMGNYQEVETQAGKRQYNLRIGGRAFMMLPVDRVLWWDPEYRQHVCAYDDDRRQFKRDAVKAWQKLTELGCQGLVEELPPKPRHDRRY